MRLIAALTYILFALILFSVLYIVDAQLRPLYTVDYYNVHAADFAPFLLLSAIATAALIIIYRWRT